MNSNFKAIIFDLGGVILNIDYHQTINAFKSLGVPNFDILYTQAKQNHVFDRFEEGKMSADEFRAYIRSESHMDLTNDQIDRAWNAMLFDLPESRVELLNQLKEKYPIFLYSNTNSIHLKAFRAIIKNQHGNAHLLEDIFQDTYYSHQLGYRKPNPEGFLHILKTHGLNASETLFIDDSEQHIKGANKIRLQTFWLKDKDVTELF
ncbi:MAG: HAD family hydrolase [Putridiphycobacter sp.]